jgi:DNA-binding CsgD family transcriptional regulator/PAS domain-containing protein
MHTTHTARGHLPLLQKLQDHEELYFQHWSERMRSAGYLEHTTAKRVDCQQALCDFMTPLLAHAEAGMDDPGFSWLTSHEGQWAQPMVESARRHRMRGITADMFLGCFKTFIHALLDVIEAMPDFDKTEKALARRRIRLYGDALEVLFVKDWTQTLPDLTRQRLDEANRLLTLEKCRFENILNSSSDLILVMDSDGVVTETNAAVKEAVPMDGLLGSPVWKVLDLEAQSMDELLKYYPPGMSCEMSPFHDEQIYRMQVTPLSSVSLASDQYMIMLTNITAQASQREMLEKVVAEKTDALRQEKEQLEGMNVTLRNVLQNIEKDRNELFDDVSVKINSLVVPALERIETEDDPSIRKGYVTVVRDQLRRLAPGSGTADPQLLKLTHMETKVAQFIQSGYASKDIATSLNLSVETVQTHRKNIRGKLGLHGKRVSLYSHLKTVGLTG